MAASEEPTVTTGRLPLRPLRRYDGRRLSLEPALSLSGQIEIGAVAPVVETTPVGVALTACEDYDLRDDALAATLSRRPRRQLPYGRGRSRNEELRRRLRQLLAVALEHLWPAPDSVLDWPAELYPFQSQGVGRLITSAELLLADDMGLGKTVQAIVAVRMLLRQRVLQRALIVVPAGLVRQWQQALGLWAPDLRVSTVRGAPATRAAQWQVAAHVWLTTYETIRSDLTPHPMSGPRRHGWDLVVLDEAQRIKNRGTAVSSACKELPRKRSWALTGTPLENSIEDLASILEFLQLNADGVAPTPIAVDRDLLPRHRDLQLRRRKEDVLNDLPPKTVQRVPLELGAEQRRSYDRAEREGIVELRAKGETLRLTNVLALILRLKQICNFCPETGASVKLDDLAERLETLSAEGHRMLVFSQFTDDVFGVDAIAARLGRFTPLTYTGALSLDERARRIELFKRDERYRALVLSLRAGGQGLNLQEASYVAHVDRWWNPAIERQAEDRSHRLGQTLPVTIYSYTCVETIEERIDELIADKQELFDTVVDEASVSLEQIMSADEIFGLFGLRRPAPEQSPRQAGSS